MSAPIEVVAIRRLDGSNSVKAFVDVRCGGITLKGCKIVQQDGQRAWLATPATKTNHGWQNVVELSGPLHERVTEVVLQPWEGEQDRVPLPIRGRAGWDRHRDQKRRDAHAKAQAQAAGEAVLASGGDEAFYDDWHEAVRDLTEGPGR
jgi:DNA-binding cell septation regulator SpoVG